MTKSESDESLREVEETQKQLRVSIDKSRELAEQSDRLLEKHRRSATKI